MNAMEMSRGQYHTRDGRVAFVGRRDGDTWKGLVGVEPTTWTTEGTNADGNTAWDLVRRDYTLDLPPDSEQRTIWWVEQYLEEGLGNVTSEVVTYDASRRLWVNTVTAQGWSDLDHLGQWGYTDEASALRKAIEELTAEIESMQASVDAHRARLAELEAHAQ